ncbi:lipocalin family protein [Flagellimonas abyssi]|uniref:Lipocalin-like domain-containing protein n=1 Tax=Flagellimonas abyssi TaxID=2864871 RepID=A0ABS7EWH2_9FLAO|nr:lipocalin family protein [Allomuricauda abyssi]MBW8201966.1 hypothetical protein [Allomuricauda abyssi]
MKYFTCNKKGVVLQLAMFATMFFMGNNEMFAQGKTGFETLLIGSWRMNEFSTRKEATTIDNEADNLSIETETRILHDTMSRVLTFNSSGVFQQVDGSGKIIKGRWQLTGSGLTICSQKGNIWKTEIVDLSLGRLVLRQSPKGDLTPIFPILHLNKIL